MEGLGGSESAERGRQGFSPTNSPGTTAGIPPLPPSLPAGHLPSSGSSPLRDQESRGCGITQFRGCAARRLACHSPSTSPRPLCRAL
ncbi:hypothetical protein T484DRAFT_3047690 [Baffinella frigidus]|nr:hypothetical protein T484DRAFT_3047690 [Cryptophyta sp. CCMP2293]